MGFVNRWFKRLAVSNSYRIVAVGGGTGISTLLRGLKLYTSDLTAVVTVTDTGGSSGRIRREWGVLPPGDLRNCLLALADDEDVLSSVLNYRFSKGELKGHSLGNLVILAMTDIWGDFSVAIKEISKVLAIKGRVLPSALTNVDIQAQMKDGRVITGEAEITAANGSIEELRILPSDVSPPKEVIRSLRKADMIVLGPGSLYTSVIPNLLVGGISDAIKGSKAWKVYVSNIMTQPGETIGFSVSDHLKELIRYGGSGIVDSVVVNTERVSKDVLQRYMDDGAAQVEVDWDSLNDMGIEVVASDLVKVEDGIVRHDPYKLALLLIKRLRKFKGR